MKQKILHLFLVLTSLMGYLEWGGGNRTFLYQAEAEMLLLLFNDPYSVIHPFTLLPLAGQLMLIATLFQKTPGRYLSIAGIAALGSLLLFMFFIGFISGNYKIVASVLPFLAMAIASAYHLFNKRAENT